MSSRVVRGVVVLLVAALVVPMALTSYVSHSAARGLQTTGTPEVGEPSGGLNPAIGVRPFIEADGIYSSVLGQASVEELASGSQLLLERLRIQPGDALPPHTAAATEILVVSAGAVTITDSFGFSASTPAGQALTFMAGSTYELTNTGAEAAEVLRLGTAEGETGISEADDIIAPSGGTPDASPVVDGGAEVILAQPIEDSLDGPVTLVLANAVFAPGATTGELAHDGPLGMVVESGTLDALSPSGLTGQLQAGAAVVLPATAPLMATNNGGGEAVVTFAGVFASGESLLTEITPTPVPTVAPTPVPTVAPTATPTPEPTEEPSLTPQPTATLPPTVIPSPTPIPPPTAVPTTEPTTILQLGETWRAESALLTVDGNNDGQGVNADQLILSIVYQNTSDQRLDYIIPSGVIRVYDDQRNSWEEHYNSDDMPGDRIILDPAESISYSMQFEPPETDHSANVFIVIEAFGGVSRAKWGVTWDAGRLLTLPPDAVDPTEGSASSGGSSSIQANQVPLGSAMDVFVILPASGDVPGGLVGNGRRSRTLTEATENYTNPAETEAQFTLWGWQGNAITSFTLPSGQQARSGEVNGVYVSIHQFGSPEFARQALDFSLTEQTAGTSLREVQARQFGEYTRALYGPMDYGNEITLLTQQGDLLIRVSAAMLDGDPSSQAESIMEVILARAGSGGTATASESAADAFPAAFLGSWEGWGTQVNPNVEWPFTISLSGGAAGSLVGTTNYPTYECGGDLYLQQATADAIVMVERLTRGLDACTSDGTITLKMQADGTLAFYWTGVRTDGSTSTASATMTKVGISDLHL